MSYNINKEELKKVTYLHLDQLEGRTVPLFPCYHNDETWELWLPSNGGLIRTKPSAMAEGKYFGKEPAYEGDVYMDFFNFMIKRAYWSQIVPFIEGIYDDLQNLAACLSKLDLFYKESKETPLESIRFVVTELEYIFSVCRSLFDLLQECNSKMWPIFKFNDPEIRKKELPISFRKIILKNEIPRTKEEIIKDYKIPEILAGFYIQHSDFFTWLREYRDNISHSGKSFDLVYVTEKGFAVSIDIKPFSSMSIWSAQNTQQNKLGSMRSLVAHLICSTFKAIEEFTQVMSRLIIFPPDIAPDYKVFIHGSHTRSLLDLETHIKDKPWYD